MTDRVERAGLQIDPAFCEFVEDEAMPGTGLTVGDFWQGVARLLAEMTPRNRALLETRESLQEQIDAWHREHGDPRSQFDVYKQFLRDIGYLVPSVGDFSIDTMDVDPEIATQAGPQLVVPIMNARFSLNATNARWGSLYDALYGTDAIPTDDGADRVGTYNPVRGARVIAAGRELLDNAAPLVDASHKDVTDYQVINGSLRAQTASGETELRDPEKFRGYQGNDLKPSTILLRNHGLHIELNIDPSSPIGSSDKAGVADITMEAALTTIQDCEDSVAAVDAADKVVVYRNWLGLMRGDLTDTFLKNGENQTRTLAEDRRYHDASGQSFTLPGRSLLFVRNVGHLMQNDAILDTSGEQIYEGILDAIMTSMIAMHDLAGNGRFRNSKTGSVYIVKPKMHGPNEVQYANDLFAGVEDLLALPRNTLKIGIMDEERRTTVNLAACIHAARERVVFINTGFLDRTGDEIHTSMEAGPFRRKDDIKKEPWIGAYENWNVDIGLACGLAGRAQIGKGMWPAPDLMADMIATKGAHPRAGATTAWVPSPNAATLHAMHYHEVDVAAAQQSLMQRETASIDDILTVPLEATPKWSHDDIQAELDNNAQGLLGYVVRWIDQGVGCSKVPDINDVGLMEDRATLRISSQHMANWLRHGICSEAQVLATLKKMAAVVDQQNAGDPNYRPMAPDFDSSIAFQAAIALVLEGTAQPSGYTEPLLHRFRLAAKAS